MKIPTFWNESTVSVVVTRTADNEPTTSSASTAKPRKQIRTVSFAAENDGHQVPPRQTYSQEELNSCYYTKTDYNTFKKTALITLKLNRAGKLSTSSDLTMRGLECRTREGAKERKDCRLSAAFVLFDEQERQQEEGIFDPELLAEKYHAITGKPQYAACIQGMCDELEVREYHPSLKSASDMAAPECLTRNFIAMARKHTLNNTYRHHHAKTTATSTQASLSHLHHDHPSFTPTGGSPAA